MEELVAHSTLLMFPTADDWPNRWRCDELVTDDVAVEPGFEDDIDHDLLELRDRRHAFSRLTEDEVEIVTLRFGLDCDPLSMKDLARKLGCSRSEVRDLLGTAIDKLRTVLTA